jgi:hypothetical protein
MAAAAAALGYYKYAPHLPYFSQSYPDTRNDNMSNTCGLCNRTYVWPADLKRHLKSKHGHEMIGIVSVWNVKCVRIVGFQNIIGFFFITP